MLPDHQCADAECRRAGPQLPAAACTTAPPALRCWNLHGPAIAGSGSEDRHRQVTAAAAVPGVAWLERTVLLNPGIVASRRSAPCCSSGSAGSQASRGPQHRARATLSATARAFETLLGCGWRNMSSPGHHVAILARQATQPSRLPRQHERQRRRQQHVSSSAAAPSESRPNALVLSRPVPPWRARVDTPATGMFRAAGHMVLDTRGKFRRSGGRSARAHPRHRRRRCAGWRRRCADPVIWSSTSTVAAGCDVAGIAPAGRAPASAPGAPRRGRGASRGRQDPRHAAARAPRRPQQMPDHQTSLAILAEQVSLWLCAQARRLLATPRASKNVFQTMPLEAATRSRSGGRKATPPAWPGGGPVAAGTAQ